MQNVDEMDNGDNDCGVCEDDSIVAMLMIARTMPVNANIRTMIDSEEPMLKIALEAPAAHVTSFVIRTWSWKMSAPRKTCDERTSYLPHL